MLQKDKHTKEQKKNTVNVRERETERALITLKVLRVHVSFYYINHRKGLQREMKVGVRLDMGVMLSHFLERLRKI